MQLSAQLRPAVGACASAQKVQVQAPRAGLATLRPTPLVKSSPLASCDRPSTACRAALTDLSAPQTVDTPGVEELKAILTDSLWGTERGLAANSDTRAEINELLCMLEASNPTPQPNEAGEKLDGSWKLVYTSNSELMALLALGRLPFVTVGDITQVVDGAALSVENRVALSAPFSRTSLSATASFEVRSPKLLQVQFQEGRVATPELLADFALPSSVEVMGNTIDLSALQAALQPLDGPVRGLVAQVGSLLSGAPDLQFPIRSASASTWLLNTYLDDGLRITRGDGGSVFVMVKEVVVVAGLLPDADTWQPAEPAVDPALAEEAVAAAPETAI